MLKQLKGLLKDSSVYGLGEFLNKGVQILFLPLIFTYLPTEDFGILEYFLTFKNLFSVALGWGIITSIQRYGDPDEGYSLKSVVSSSLYAMLAIDLILTGILCVASYYWIDVLLGDGLFLASLLTIITSFFFALRSIPLGILRLRREPSKYLVVSFLNVIVYLLVTFILVVFYDLTYLGFLYGGVVGIISSALFGYIFISDLVSFKFNRGLAYKLYVFGASVLTTSLCYTILNSTSRLFLKHTGSFTDVAIVGMSNKLALFVGAIIVAPFSLAWLPFVNEISKKKNFQELLGKVQVLYTIFAAILILLISLFSKEVLMLAKDQDYELASYYVPYFSIAYLLQGLYFIYSAGIYLEKKSKYYLYLAVLTTVSNLLLYVVFLNILNVLIASIITVLSFLIQLLLAKYYSRDTVKIKLLNKDMLIIFMAMFTMLWVGILGFDSLSLILGLVAKLALIVTFLILVGFLTSAKKDIIEIKSIVQKRFF